MQIVRPQNAREISEFYPRKVFHEGANFEKILKIIKNFEFLKKKLDMMLLLYEFSRGNQVDGSPRVANNTKTVAKRKSREPRTQMHLTMKNMFLNVIASQSMRWNSIISLSYVLRLWMEVVRSQNARAISEFQPQDLFHEYAIFEFFFEKSQNFRIFEKTARDNAPALRVLAREPG